MTLGTSGIAAAKLAYAAQTIASGTTTDAFDLKGGTLVGVLIPADLTSTTFTITACDTLGGTYQTVKNPFDSGNAYTFTIGATSTGFFVISEAITKGLRFIKLVFGSSETDKTIKLAYRSID